MKTHSTVLALLAAMLLGCGMDSRFESVGAPASFRAVDQAYSASEAPTGGEAGDSLDFDDASTFNTATRSEVASDPETDDDAPGQAQPAPADNAAAARRIIYTATLRIVVDDLGAAETAIRKMADQSGGYVASFSEDRSFGDRRGGQWVLRIPTKEFDRVMDQAGNLGVPESRKVDSEDVTEQFVDLSARIKNKRRLEQELLELLDNREGELKDVIELERELSRVREEIERIEGRLRYLTDRVSLTTITIHAREEQDYKPPQAPTFSVRISDSWQRSLAGLQTFGENLVLAAVIVAPWLAVFAVVLFVPIALWRWRRRRAS